MKLRSIALAGVAVIALSTPAMAGPPGWYLGLGAGYDSLSTFGARDSHLPAPNLAKLSYSSSGLGIVFGGYNWGNGFRFEGELGYSAHDISKMILTPGGTLVKP